MPTETSTTFPGIHNEHEFYSQHYLTEIFSGDARETVKRWRDEAADAGERTPDAKLRALAGEYQRFRNAFDREKDHKERVSLQRGWFRRLLEGLGHKWEPANHTFEDGEDLPALVMEASLAVCGAYDSAGDGDDPLELKPHKSQFHGEAPPGKIVKETWNEIVTGRIFGQQYPPRWTLLLSFGQVLLLERGKWTHNRLLRFDLREIFSRRDDSTLKAMAVLLHRSSLMQDSGECLLDTLDENSHKHAFGVSEDLKYALRESIELIGNEVVWYLREVNKEKVYEQNEKLAHQLSLECVRYMYRLLFILYIEARPELGYAPIESEEYRKGYSLEHLRDLELVRLTNDESLDNYYLHHSIETLFRLIREGCDTRQREGAEDMFADGRGYESGFRIRKLDSALFREESTPLINRVKLRNRTLQRVIELVSLTRPAKGKRRRRGRISYAQLGINQLGAVYEALLSYRGFFAENDLYEVKSAKEKNFDDLKRAYFVTAGELDKYNEDERVYERDADGRKALRRHPKGSFIYRLSGREREDSASYYTPESLTQAVVKYALKELITDDMPAERILELTICEPAMGSAAFLNEAVNQLSEKYLERRQRELGKRIPHDKYQYELQRVKHAITDRNVFGVDLNPMAVEMAQVSLWLNCIDKDGHVPWFGFQLFTGNSLIGARRQVYSVEDLSKKKKNELWFNKAPERVQPGLSPKRPPGTVYHFLLPDPGMVDYRDKTVREMAPEEFEQIAAWRKNFFKPFSESDIRKLEAISDEIDRLWELHTKQLTRDRSSTHDTIEVWGHSGGETTHTTSNVWKDRIREQGIFGGHAYSAQPYQLLKLAMDYWCSLWSWPIMKASELPNRDNFLLEMGHILTGRTLTSEVKRGQTELNFGKEYREHENDPTKQITEKISTTTVDKLLESYPRLKLVVDLSNRYHFHHWELLFSDIFYQRRRHGFDLVLGNPPWIKVEWKDIDVFQAFNPLFAVRNFTKSMIQAAHTNDFGKNSNWIDAYYGQYVSDESTRTFLGKTQNYPLLSGIQSNLFKCFLTQSWIIMNTSNAVVGLLHPEGVYDDPKGGTLRSAMYPRLRVHFQFRNERKLFPEVHHMTRFSINVYGNPVSVPSFLHISNLFLPATISHCLTHSGTGDVPTIKDKENAWSVAGHERRLVWIDEEILFIFSKILAEDSKSELEARMPTVHSRDLINVLRKFADCSQRLQHLHHSYCTSRLLEETSAQSTKIIERKTYFPLSADEWILSGPHYYSGNPLAKSPRRICKINLDYDTIDLTNIADDYRSRTNYQPVVDRKMRRVRHAQYERTAPIVPWKKVFEIDLVFRMTNYFRIVNRNMVSPDSERTLTVALVPPATMHVHTTVGTAFSCDSILLDFLSVCLSIPADFLIKITGMVHIDISLLNKIPMPKLQPKFRNALHIRSLSLSCLTNHYSALWKSTWIDAFQTDQWTRIDRRLPAHFFEDLNPYWHRNYALRTDYSRRQVLVEIDVLVSMALDLTLDELKQIYRIQFPIMRQYENDTWYDTKGRIVFTVSKGLPGVGLPRKAKPGDDVYGLVTPERQESDISLGWEDIKDLKKGIVTRRIQDDTLPNGPIERTIEYHAPFDRCDRETDYEIAWNAFEERFSENT